MQIAGTRHGGGWLVAVVVVLAGLGGAPGVAVAQAPSYQPDSPAGSEYAIPLDEARKTGSTSGARGGPSGASQPQQRGSAAGEDDDQSGLFGEGVAPDEKASAAGGSARKSAKTSMKATRFAPVAPSDVERVRAAGSGISGTAVALGTGGLVLLLGAALTGAIVMSRRMPRSR